MLENGRVTTLLGLWLQVQNKNIRKNKITFGHECIDVMIGKPTGDDLAKKYALIIIAKNLYRLKPK